MVESLESITMSNPIALNEIKSNFLEIKLKIPYTAIINGNSALIDADAKVGYDGKNKALKITFKGKNYYFNSEKNGSNQYIGKKFNEGKKEKKMNLEDLNTIHFLSEAFNKYTYKPEVRLKFNIQSEFDILRAYFAYMKTNIETLISEEKNKAVLKVVKKNKPEKFKEYKDEQNTIELYKIVHEFKGDNNDTHYFFKSKGERFNNAKKGLMNLTMNDLEKAMKPKYLSDAKNFIESLKINELKTKSKVNNNYKLVTEKEELLITKKTLQEKMNKLITSQGVNEDTISQNKSMLNEIKGGVKLKNSIREEYLALEAKAREELSFQSVYTTLFLKDANTASVQEINATMRRINQELAKKSLHQTFKL